MSGWRTLVLGESLEVLIDNRGKNPPFEPDGVPAVSGVCVGDGTLDLSVAKRVSLDTWKRWMPVPTRRNDVILTSEAPLGRVALVPNDERLTLAQRVFGLRGKPGVLDSRFLYYAFQSTVVQSDLQGRATGTTVVGIRQPALRAVCIPAPEFKEQQAIAEVLGALDDKIAANARLADTADFLVRAQYAAYSRSVPNEIAIGDSIALIRDTVSPESFDAATSYVGLEHISRRRMWLADSGSAGDVSSTKSRFDDGDVLFGKLRPYFHKVVSAPWPGVCSTDILVLRAKDRSMSGWALAMLSSDDVVAAATAPSRGTRMPRTSWQDIAAIRVPWSSGGAVELSQAIGQIRDAVVAGLEESRTLAALRDTLLPALMSGRLRVRDAERSVEAVV